MKQIETEKLENDTFVVHLKGGRSFEAVDSVDITAALDDGTIKMSHVFKAWEPEFEFYYLVTVDADNVEYLEETYTDDTWERLVQFTNVEYEDDADVTDVLFG